MASIVSRTESAIRRLLGVGFGASLASATVAAVPTGSPSAATGSAVVALLGAAIGAAFSSLIGAYAWSWPAVGLGAACGAVIGIVPDAVPPDGRLVAACWVSAIVASAAVRRQRQRALLRATSPALVAALHVLQLPLIAFSVAVSLVSPRPRPFVVLFTACAFALWRLLGKCPLTHAEERLRARRGEALRRPGEIGFIGRQIHQATGILIPRESISGLAYAAAAMAFTWYAVQALL